MRQKLIELKGKIDKFTIVDGDFNIPLSEMDRFSRKKISKDMAELHNTIHQLDMMDMCRLLHPTMAKYFSGSHGTFVHQNTPCSGS